MNRRNFQIFGWRELELKFEYVIFFIIFLIVLSLILFYFFKDSKNEIEKVMQQKVNETKPVEVQVSKPIVQENNSVIDEPKVELTEYEVLNWDPAQFSSVCKQDYIRYKDDVNDINSQIDELSPDLEEARKTLDELEYRSNDLKLKLEKRTSQLKKTVEQCK